MNESRSTSIADTLRNRIYLPNTTQALNDIYRNAKPFPYIVIDGLFPDETLDQILNETPALNGNQWFHHNSSRLNKFNLRSAVDLGEKAFQHVSFLHSAAFLYLISEITGIWGLLPDPYLGGGGYHIIPQGGKFDIHADRNTDHSTGLTRRVAMITYLNKNWEKSHGGQLELWNADATRCEFVVEPLFNRTILFEVGDKNFHGVTPSDRTRRSFAIYFHTVGAEDGSTLAPHNSVYLPITYQRKRSFREVLKRCIPPILLGY